MPFPSSLSGANQTTKRGGILSATRYIAALTPTVQLQFNPSVASTGKPAALITRSTQLSGSHNNLLYGMTVYITPSSDYLSDLKNRPEECLKTYVREVAPTSTVVYIGWTAYQWTTGHYVTVVSNFEPHQKKTRVFNGAIYKNVSVAYRPPMPRITDLYAMLTVTSAANANVSPTPTEEAMASGASISSRTWAVIENGVVTKAVSTSATPTFNLDLGIHWLHLTTTDSNGIANWFAVMVVICPANFSSVVNLDLVASQVNSDLNNGIKVGFNSPDSVSALVPGSAALVFSNLNYADASTAQVIEAFGWLDGETSLELAGDEEFGRRLSYDTSVVGIKEAAQTIRIPGFPFGYDVSPSAWGEVERSTVYDAIWYAASEHSTVANLAAFKFPTSYTNYQYNPAIQIPEGTLFDSLSTLAFFASGGQINYAPQGDLVFEQSLLYVTSSATRDSAVVYATYTPTSKDITVFRATRPPVNKFALASIQAGLATWNTTTNTPRVYNSIAPADETPAALLEKLDGIIMVKNLTDAQAKVEAGKLAVNHFFASVQSPIVSAEFPSGWITICASSLQWHKFGIAVTDTLDGTLYDTNTRFICTSVSSTYDPEQGGMLVSAEFREETDGGDNYAQETTFVPIDTSLAYPTYPLGEFSPYLSDFETPSDYYGSGYDETHEGYEDPTLPPETASENASPGAGVAEILYVPLTGGAIGSATTSVNGDDYLLRISGKGRIAEESAGGEWCYRFDFRDNDGGFVASTSPASSTILGTYVAGDGWTYTDVVSATHFVRGLSIDYTLSLGTSRNYTSFIVEYSYTYGHLGVNFLPVDNPTTEMWRFRNGGSGLPTLTVATLSSGGFQGTNKTWEISHPTGTYLGSSATFQFCAETSNDNVVPKTYDGTITVHAIEVHGTGANPFPSNNCGVEVIGDALWYAGEDVPPDTYAAGGGLLLNGTSLVHALEYNPSGTYEVEVTGDGNQFVFSFNDNYDGDATNNQNANIKVEIIPL
jgi:hypothetical protein